jgi:hypothetical protein
MAKLAAKVTVHTLAVQVLLKLWLLGPMAIGHHSRFTDH